MAVEDQDPGRPAVTLGRPPTMSDVARRAGVSRQLVSLALRKESGPSAASRARILQAASELGFHAHGPAQLLRQNRTMTVGACFKLQNAFETTVVERLFGALSDHGLRLALAPVAEGRPTDLAIGELMAVRVEALIAFNPDPASPVLATAIERMPVVWLGGRDPSGRCDNVHVDDRQGLQQVVEHLTGLGHTRIAYAGGLSGTVGQDRLDAYRDAMRAAGLERSADVIECGFEHEDGALAATSILSRAGDRPTALVCSSDQAAAAALVVFARCGVVVPRDISLVGFDDERLAALSCNDLTSVHQDVDLSVRAALDIVLARLAGSDAPRRTSLIPTTLTHRSSVAPPR